MPEARIKRGLNGRFQELHPTLVDVVIDDAGVVTETPLVVQEFPQRVWIEHEAGVIKALHRIDFQWDIHMNGGNLVVSPDFPLRELIEMTNTMGGDSARANRRPATAVDDNDIVDNFVFNPTSKILTRRS